MKLASPPIAAEAQDKAGPPPAGTQGGEGPPAAVQDEDGLPVGVPDNDIPLVTGWSKPTSCQYLSFTNTPFLNKNIF